MVRDYYLIMCLLLTNSSLGMAGSLSGVLPTYEYLLAQLERFKEQYEQVEDEYFKHNIYLA